MKVKINRIKGNALSNLLTKMLRMDPQVYLTLSNEVVTSNVYLPTKDVVKSTTVNIADVFDLDQDLESPLKMGFFNGKKIIEALNYFDMSAIHGHIVYETLNDENFVQYLELQDNTLKIKLNCLHHDLGFISMTSAQQDIAFSDAAKKFEFQMTETDLKKIISLNTIGNSDIFSIHGDEQGIHIKGSTYDYIIDDSVTEVHEKVHVHNKQLERIDAESYVVTVCSGAQNKIICNSISTDTKVAINLALGVDSNTPD